MNSNARPLFSLCHERRLYVKEISKLERVKHDKYNTLASLSQGARFGEMDHRFIDVRHSNNMVYKNNNAQQILNCAMWVLQTQ